MPRRGSYNYSADPTTLFEMGDDRSDAVLVKKPTFINSGQLTRENLRPVVRMNGGKDTVFTGGNRPWHFLQTGRFSIIFYPGRSHGRHYHAGVDEVYL
jgi:hypothetical protein